MATNAAKVISIAIFLLLMQGCKITQVVSANGAIVSRTGNYDCPTGQTCVIDVVNGSVFSDTFTAAPNAGYRFAGWKKQNGYLCGGNRTPCALENVPASFTAVDVGYLPGTDLRKNRFIEVPPGNYPWRFPDRPRRARRNGYQRNKHSLGLRHHCKSCNSTAREWLSPNTHSAWCWHRYRVAPISFSCWPSWTAQMSILWHLASALPQLGSHQGFPRWSIDGPTYSSPGSTA